MNSQQPNSNQGRTTTLSWQGERNARSFSLAPLLAWFKAAAISEIEARRLFLWIPVAAGSGVVIYMSADHEPSLLLLSILTFITCICAYFTRNRPVLFGLALAFAALFCGMLSAGLRTYRVAAPVLDRIRIAELSGFVEQVDLRVEGARIVLRIDKAEGLTPQTTPYRVRVTSRKTPNVQAGDYVSLKARLLPPSHASIPGGYDFARDAFFARIGAVGSVLGQIKPAQTLQQPSLLFRFYASIDRARNALAVRVQSSLKGDSAAIAVAMVTGKRDFLTESAKDTVREAGIFHIITISGVQMTLVAGILFGLARLVLTAIPGLALRYPIKKWAAAFAMVGAILYDIASGSRVGTERALFMTLIMLSAVIMGRPALTMRNLGLAVLAVITFEPEAILGASFQLSFAAVAALVAVYEARIASRMKGYQTGASSHMWQPKKSAMRFDLIVMAHNFWHKVREAGLATICATGATASFMAYDFHELSPYVLIGNPLTLLLIEFFAVPCALLGTVLYPFGLDGPIWAYLGFGIDGVLHIAHWLGSMPGATLHLKAFAPWSIVFLSLGVISMVIWRSWAMRLMAMPLFAIGLIGTVSGKVQDILIPPTPDVIAIRGADGQLGLLGHKINRFAAEQWLRADGDGRSTAKTSPALSVGECDKLGCVGKLYDGRVVALINDRAAFPVDCARANIIITTERAPDYCKAELIIDRRNLEAAGAISLAINAKNIEINTARSVTEDRPWSPLNLRAWANWPSVMKVDKMKAGQPDEGDVVDVRAVD